VTRENRGSRNLSLAFVATEAEESRNVAFASQGREAVRWQSHWQTLLVLPWKFFCEQIEFFSCAQLARCIVVL
jgi:hypothetical protein